MKKIIAGFGLFLVCVVPVFGQLNVSHNGIRVGDVIVKQQVEYRDPGDAGRNRVWDFSQLKTINDAYRLCYSLPPLQGDSLYMMGDYCFDKRGLASGEELIIGTEHNTMYYYRLKNDTLYLLGHENPSVRLTYIQPIVLGVFPLNYGGKVGADYVSKGVYSSTVGLSTRGSVSVVADAFGKMVLPNGDTVSPVLRVKTTKLIMDTREQFQIDTAKVLLANKGKQLEIYQWYTKGYRYPIFETVRNVNVADGSEIFSTAFFFPLQDHFYLESDPENLALLDSLWSVEEDKLKSIDNNQVTVSDNDRYRVYPNPVQSTLYIDYILEEVSPVSIQLFTLSGVLVKAIEHKAQAKGSYTEKINCAGLPVGTYLLILKNKKKTINEKVIKK